MTEAIGKLPRGTWTNSMRIDGYEGPIDLVATVTIDADQILVDYTGTSGMSSYAINCPLCYTEAYTTFGSTASSRHRCRTTPARWKR